MPLSTELKWLSIFKLIFGQANYWFQNFIKSDTYHSSETHRVKLLNNTSSDNCWSCWAADKVRERPRTAGDEMANLGRQGRGRPQQLQHGQWSTILLSPSWSHTVTSSLLHTLQKAVPAPARMKMSCPQSKHQQAANFNCL